MLRKVAEIYSISFELPKVETQKSSELNAENYREKISEIISTSELPKIQTKKKCRTKRKKI